MPTPATRRLMARWAPFVVVVVAVTVVSLSSVTHHEEIDVMAPKPVNDDGDGTRSTPRATRSTPTDRVDD